MTGDICHSAMELPECRLCLNRQATIPIWGISKSLATQIQSYSRPQVRNNTGLPHKICSLCESNLKSFTQFKNTCKESDKPSRSRLIQNMSDNSWLNECNGDNICYESHFYNDNEQSKDTFANHCTQIITNNGSGPEEKLDNSNEEMINTYPFPFKAGNSNISTETIQCEVCKKHFAIDSQKSLSICEMCFKGVKRKANAIAVSTYERRAPSLKTRLNASAMNKLIETPEHIAVRREANRIAKARHRAAETPKQRAARREADRIAKARQRAAETPEQRAARQESDRIAKAISSATETHDQQAARRVINTTLMASHFPNEYSQVQAVSTADITLEQLTAKLETNGISIAVHRTVRTPEQRAARREANRNAQARHRAAETPEQRAARLEANRIAKARHRAAETPEQRAARQEADRIAKARRGITEASEKVETTRMCSSTRRATETPEQREARRIWSAARRAAETPEQRAARREADRISKAMHRASETPEQRAARLKADRIAKATHRATETRKNRISRSVQTDEIIHSNTSINKRNTINLI